MTIKRCYGIKGKTWSVEYKWGLRHEDVVVDGLCDPETRTIYLRRELSREDKALAFLHEWGHAVCHEAHLGEAGGIEGFQEEVVVSAFADAIASTFELRHKRGAR